MCVCMCVCACVCVAAYLRVYGGGGGGSLSGRRCARLYPRRSGTGCYRSGQPSWVGIFSYYRTTWTVSSELASHLFSEK